ncbi:membrane protein [Streptosporangium violaceochromogenes]|nr:membrane protein [Streptosporangium violaceochromogenes]
MGKGMRHRAARERLAEAHRRKAVGDRRRKMLVGVLGGLVMASAAVIVVVAVAGKVSGGDRRAVAYRGPLAPVSRQADGSILMAKKGVTGPTLEVFEDFQCPSCKRLEEAAGDAIKKAAADGKARVIFRPFQLFRAPAQPEPAPSVSRRGANAALCAPADRWASYTKTLFAYQPEEGREGFENRELLNWAKDLGFRTPEFEKCVTGMQKAGDVDKSTRYAQEQKVGSTPTLKLNGRALAQEQVNGLLSDPAGLERILAGATSASDTSQGTSISPPSGKGQG